MKDYVKAHLSLPELEVSETLIVGNIFPHFQSKNMNFY